MGRKKNLKPVKGPRLFLGYLGLFLILIGFILLVPLALIPFYPSEGGEYHLFLGPSIISIIIGIPLLLLIVRRPKARMTQFESLFLLLTLWIMSILIASLPFMITGEFTFTQAVFETTSGLSTTAETLLDAEGIKRCSHIFLFYRAWLLFMGGIGLTLILTSALSDVNNLSIYHLEGHDDKLLPNLVKSSRMILLIYTGYIALGYGAYRLCGMPRFDSLCTSISALSTGGFSVNPAGIAGYASYCNGLGIEIVTEILMLLGATNFVIHFALMRGKFKTLFYHCEFFVFMILFLCFFPMFFAAYYRYYTIWRPGPLEPNPVGMSVRRGIFLFVSSITSTGFSIEDSAYMYNYMDSFLTVSLLLCLVIGGQSGSTAGGIKQMRLVQAVKEIHWSVQDLIKGPHIIQPHTIVKYGKKVNVGSDEGKSATAFIFIYIVTILFFSFIFTCTDSYLIFGNALYETINLISGAGFTSGIINAAAVPAKLWTGTLTMLVGRLEPIIFIMVIAEGWGAVSKKIHERRVDRRQNAI